MTEAAGELSGFLSGAMWQTGDSSMYGTEEETEGLASAEADTYALAKRQYALYSKWAEDQRALAAVKEEWLKEAPAINMEDLL